MAGRITWDEYETALLIDTFWEIEKDPNRRRELIKGLSDALRQKGINSGIMIDEKFRNVNGITMQLSPIAHAFFPERPSLTSSAMFSRMVELYKTDREAFNKTLAKAKSMVAGDSVKNGEPDVIPSFSEWLSEVNYKRFSSQQLISALEDASKYAIERKLFMASYSRIADPAKFSSVMRKVQGMRFFRITHPGTSRYLDPAITLYRRYLQSLQRIKATAASIVEEPQAVEKNLVEAAPHLTINETQQKVAPKDVSFILKEHYQYGFKPDSYRELLRFRQFAEADGVDIPEDDDDLKTAILSVGTLVDGKVFAKSDDFGQELCGIVNTIVEAGTRVIYYEVLLERHNEWMQTRFVTSEAMLKELLQKNLQGFAFSKKFMVVGAKKTEKQSVTDEIKRIWGDNKTCSVEEIGERLPYIPIENIWRVISGNVNFIWVAEGIYLLIDRFIITEDEEDAILEYVESTCNENGFASLSDVPREEIEEQNYEISQAAILSAIYNKVLAGKYMLNGKILTKDNSSLDAVTLLKQHLEGREKCTFNELADRVVDLTGGTNRQFAFQALYDCMVRIDSDNYVANRFVSFNVDEIDGVLSEIITNHFCAIRNVTTFALFPVCGYPWNSFLLESYCYKYSKKYSLRLLNFNDKNAGIIAEKDYDKSYIEMLAIALAGAKVDLKQEEIGLYLFQTGYMAKRKYARLGEIAERAKELREDK